MLKSDLKFGVIGNGSWATALVKILSDSKHAVNWWVRNKENLSYIQKRRHNPHYLSSAYFDTSLLSISNDINAVLEASDVLVLAVPSAYIKDVLSQADPHNYDIPLTDYFAVLGPCH